MINHKPIPKLFYIQIQKNRYSTTGEFELMAGEKTGIIPVYYNKIDLNFLLV
jgi:hypothetical protein